ncbi:MAG: T9SS type A sorting domain-containing protein [Candidatus Kapabacteria bacterium]|nr:T9SS type A sorting domain-containing protein [Candidatus Kapabacteria bacterium]
MHSGNLCIRTLFITLVLGILVAQSYSQQSQHERDFRSHFSEAQRDEVSSLIRNSITAPPAKAFHSEQQRVVRRTVFGYYPYWTVASYTTQLDARILTHIAYFSADADSAGTVTVMNSNRILSLRDFTSRNNITFSIVLTMFGNAVNTAVLGSEQKSRRVVSQMMALVRLYQFNGVDVDAETVPTAQRANLVRFMRIMRDSLNSQSSALQLSMATPAVDWSNAFDLSTLSKLCNHLTLMGYDYHYSGSPTAGPVAPLRGESYNVTRSVQTYIQAGVDAGSLLLGVPWYGYEWAVKNDVRKAETDPKRGAGKSYTYSVAQRRAQQVKNYDTLTQTPWYILRDSTGSFQGWFDDSTSLGMKYKLANGESLQGIGIWALGYEGTDGTLTAGVLAAFPYQPVSVDDTEILNAVTVYPNPAGDMITVTSSTPLGSYSLCNAAGIEVLRGQTEESMVTLNVLTLPSGVYCLRSANAFQRIVIVR